ncbi:Protein CBG26802 [Caenorhabditis briggsae]|uniref:Protein CBG26802 n=1 Tax=Caenorhabditis briggsae TaxID=6238 RepID=B6IIB8_CAEBR|nr:Protein CBG26802 [Caenorhabditis briggsae]CAR99648.1 Protein CBG26802 [Caenorhabditis briggsae]
MKLLEEREVRLAKNNEIEAKFRAEIKQKTSLKLVNCVATATDGNQGGQGSSTDLQKRERIAAASSSESNEEPKPDSSIVKSLRSKVKDLEQDKERLEEENQSLKAISSGKKMLGRIEGGNLSQSKENEEFQRQDGGRTRRKFSGSKKSIEARMPGEYYLEKEKARENVHNETMNGILPEYGGEEQKFFAKPHYQSSWNMGRSSEMAMFAMMQQMRTEDRLPERSC